MKKSTFDGRPELLEQEGAVMRINFDVESVMEPVPSMDGGEQGEREVFKAYVIRVPLPFSVDSVKAALMAEGFDEYKSEAVACEAVFVSGGSSDIDMAKQMVIARISAYDTSDAVNGFYLNGREMWIPRELRNELTERIAREEARGHDTVPFDYNGQEITLPINDDVKAMLEQLKYYADDCYTQTQRHKAAVTAKRSVNTVLNYDYTTGYPTKPTFNI